MQRRNSLLGRALMLMALGLSLVIAVAGWLNYRQVAEGLRVQALKQMELYVKERSARESELFQLAEEELQAVSAIWDKPTNKLDNKTLDARFDSLFEAHTDGTRRLRAEHFDRNGITGVIRQQIEITRELKTRLVNAYDLLQRFGPVLHSRFENLYLAVSNTAVLMYWPENRWGLDVDFWEISMKLAAPIADSQPESPRKADWSNLYFDYGASDWLMSANLPLSESGQDRVAVDIRLNTLFERTVDEALEGTYNMIIHKNGDLISHPHYMDAILASGGNLSLQEVVDTDLKNLYLRVKQYWRESAIVDHPEKNEFLAVSRLSGPSWYLIIVFPYALIDAQAVATAQKTLALFAIALLCGLALLYTVLKRMIAKPLRNLVGATEQLAEGDLSTRVAIPGQDEMGELGHAFNSMAARLEEALVSRDRLSETQEELRQSEQRFSYLVEYSPDAIMILDAETGKYVQVNDNGARLFGYSREELVNMGPLDVCPKFQPNGRLSKEIALESIKQALSGQPVTLESWHQDANGELIYTEVHLVRMPSRKGKLIRGNMRDITERHRMEQALIQSEQRFSSLFQLAPAAVTLLDVEEHHWVDVNENTERLYGYSRKELLNMHPADVSPERQLDGQLSSEAAENVLQQTLDGETPCFEWQHIRKNGENITCEVRLALHPSSDRRLVQASIIDITQRKKDEKALEQARDAAETSNRAKSRFLANMSHEFRTPLNAILGFTRLTLDDSDINPKQKENLSMVQRSGEHLLELINDVLEISKVEAGRIELQESVFDLYELLDTLEQMIRLRAEDKGLSIQFHINKNVPIFIQSDQRKLRQILINLLGNAVKFTREGEIELTSNYSQLNSGKLLLEFEITDTGIGLSKLEAAILFQPFAQASVDTDNHEGTGLGLAISKQFVELMGGKITVESEPKKGATFRFFIQVNAANKEDIAASPVKRRVIGLEPGQTDIRLLIVEDKAENRLLLRRVLESAGLEVREAENGQVGIEIFKQWAPHLIWMDMRMPVMDGYEATQQIKASDQGQATAIISLTASAFAEQRSLILDAGCDDFVRKPFQPYEIFDVLSRHLGLRFIYEDIQAEPSVSNALPLKADDLAILDNAVLNALSQAAASADTEKIAVVIKRIEQQHPSIATGLRKLVEEFRFERILFLCGENNRDDQ